MKIKNTTYSILLCGLIAVGLTACAMHKHEDAMLQSEAKVSKTEAQNIALAKVPGGKIKEGELEKEKGRLIWSFDIAMPGTKDIKEVHVDAITGEVLSVETESAAAEKKEKKEEDEKK